MAAAREAASRITDNFQRVAAYQRVSLAQFGAGDIEGARNAIELARYAADGIDDYVLKSVSYSNLAKRQAAFGDVSEARESIKMARVAFGQIKDNLMRIIVKEEIAESDEYVETVDSKKITRLLSSGNMLLPGKLLPVLRIAMTGLLHISVFHLLRPGRVI